jgi:hypothetical protein
MTVEERVAYLGLERADARGDVRLDGVELACGTRDTARAGNSRECEEISQLHEDTVREFRTIISQLFVSNELYARLVSVSRTNP